MFREIKSLTDSEKSSKVAVTDISFPLSYTKGNKLISALYMVTDMMENDEPLKKKLRTLGTDIISDMHSMVTLGSGKSGTSIINVAQTLELKVSQILSFLDVASSVNLISQMNSSILKKEFLELRQSLVDFRSVREEETPTLSEFFLEDSVENSKGHTITPPREVYSKGHHKGHVSHRLGVQKGSTLMQALSDRIPSLNKNKNATVRSEAEGSRSEFDALKKQRREEITAVVRHSPNGATITDIKTTGKGSLVTLGEKTLQRELVSMVKDNILKKTGEKRWSRYSLV